MPAPVPIESAQAGRFLSPATWVGGVVPGDGTVCAVAHDPITIDEDLIVGASLAAGVNAITIREGGGLFVRSNVKLTARGGISSESAGSSAAEDEEMLDFGDIGGVYNDSSLAVAVNNTSVLQAYLNANAGTGGIEMKFSGDRNPAYNNRRIGQPAYFDLSGGPIYNIGNATVQDELTFVGVPGGKVIGLNSPAPNTPLFKITRVAGYSTAISLIDLHIQNPTGSGVHFAGNMEGSGPGQSTRMYRCRLTYIGTALNTPHPNIDRDGWTDVYPEPIVPYGIWVYEADGMMFYDVTVRHVNGHGLVGGRWNRGHCHSSTRDCHGSGIKVHEVQGTYLDVVSEANRVWGMHVRDCGQYRRTTAGLKAASGAPNLWRVWFEGNNGRDATVWAYGVSPGSGYAWRQCRIESSSGIEVVGHSGWQDNKVDMTESVRRSNIFVDRRYIDPSPDGDKCILLYDMNNDGISDPTSVTYSNWAAAWPDAGYRPTITTTGSAVGGDLEVQMTVPAGAYDEATAGAWWKFHDAVATEDHDMLFWEAEISGDAGAVAYCVDREGGVGAARQPAWLGSMSIWGPNEGLSNFALWNTGKRKFCGRVYMENNRTSLLQFYPFVTGMADTAGSGTSWPETPLTINLHSLKFYRIKAS